MNQAKYAAAKNLNAVENSLKIVDEECARIEALLVKIRGNQDKLKARMIELRAAVAAFPEDAP